VIPFDNLVQPIWEVSPYPIAVISFERDPRQRKFFYVNSAFTALTGYTAVEAVGSPFALLGGPKTSKSAIEECEAAIARGQAATAAVVHYRKDGSPYVANMTVAPLVEPDGHAHFLISIETLIASRDPEAATETAAPRSVVVPLSLPMPLKEFPGGIIPNHLVSHPELDALQAVWTRLRGDRPLPQRGDFDLRTMLRWAPHLSIATAMPAGRFQFRLFGTDLARVYGQDLTGRFLDELAPRDLWSVITLHYQEVVRTLQPLFAPISVANGRWYSEISRLLLPLAVDGDGATVSFIMGCDYVRSVY
jgi:PAS domain S-box-containing protein